VPDGPPVWICGDCHVGNLGPVGNVKGRIDIEIRDFDQTVIGNPAHDLIRLGLSLATAARGSDLPGVTTAKMIEEMIEGYGQALDGEYLDQDERPESVRVVMKRAVGRTWKHRQGTHRRHHPDDSSWKHVLATLRRRSARNPTAFREGSRATTGHLPAFPR